MIRLVPVPSRRYLRWQLVWFFGWVLITGLCIFLHASPDGHGTHTQLGLPPCGSVLLLGRPCPACGLTTSFTATVHGNFRAAFIAHPFGTFFYALYSISGLLALYGWFRKLYVDTRNRYFNYSLSVLMVVYMIYGIYRFITVCNLTW